LVHSPLEAVPLQVKERLEIVGCRNDQKKSKSGIATPRREIALIEQRLKRAREDYDRWLASAKTKSR